MFFGNIAVVFIVYEYFKTTNIPLLSCYELIILHQTHVMLKDHILISEPNKRIASFFLIIVFIVCYVFFYVIHPLAPIDSDDWEFLSKFRLALPVVNAWNPTRVFPEMLQAFCGYIAAYVIYPISRNYYNSLIIVNAAVVSAAITVYAYYFKCLMEKRFNRTSLESILLTTLFLLLHFMALRVADSGNSHLFYCFDVTCYYFYLIPNLIISCLIMSLLCDNWLVNNDFSNIKKGFVWLVIYLMVCSNLFCSILLVAFVGLQALVKWPGSSRESIKLWLKKNWKSIAIVVFWLLINVFEVNGGRAKNLDSKSDLSLFSGLLQSVQHVADLQVNRIFLLILFLALVWEIGSIIKHRKINSLTLEMLLTFVCVLIYDILLCSKAGTIYWSMAHSMFPLFFCVLIFLFYKVNSLLDRWPFLTMALPFLILLVYSYTNRTPSTFLDVEERYFDNGKFDLKAFQDINNQIVSTVVEGCANGNDSVFIIVPEMNETNHNWPFIATPKKYENYVNTLHKHGLIQYKPQGRIIVSPDYSSER